jgi:Fur family transcriptional regulator, ferric uptake regulator
MHNNEILKNNNLSITTKRMEILKVLTNAQIPLSEKEIESILKIDCNRTTIYRNLNALVNKGILHRIMADGAVKYKFIQKGVSHKSDEHVHFKCDICNMVVCMPDMPVQFYSLPKGFTGTENQFLILGVCRECNSKK